MLIKTMYPTAYLLILGSHAVAVTVPKPFIRRQESSVPPSSTFSSIPVVSDSTSTGQPVSPAAGSSTSSSAPTSSVPTSPSPTGNLTSLVPVSPSTGSTISSGRISSTSSALLPTSSAGNSTIPPSNTTDFLANGTYFYPPGNVPYNVSMSMTLIYTDIYGDYGNSTWAAWVARQPPDVTRQNGRKHNTLDDIDRYCGYPDPLLFPHLTLPLNEYGGLVQTPGFDVWRALRMDEWLRATFDACPYVTNVRNTDTGASVPFVEILGRLMLGRTAVATPQPTCDANFRCSWGGPDNGERSIRGDVYSPDNRPDIFNPMPPAYLEVYRRWYAMQALANIHDFNRASATALSLSLPLVQARTGQLISAFNPQFEAAKTFGQMTLGDLTSMISALASFTPAGPFVSGVIAGTRIVMSIIGGDEESRNAAVELLTDSIGDLPTGDRRALETGESLSAAEVVALQTEFERGREDLYENIGKVLSAANTITNIIRRPRGVEEATFSPLIPIEITNIEAHLADLFAEVIIESQRNARVALNGNPFEQGGYLRLVYGGLFSGWARTQDDNGVKDPNATTIPEPHVDRMIPSYVAFWEDQIVQVIMRLNGVWLLKQEHRSLRDCRQMFLNMNPLPWVGNECLEYPSDDGPLFYSYMPVSGEMGRNAEVIGAGESRWQMMQTWNGLSPTNFPGVLRSERSGRRHPTTLSSAYRKSERCHQATNARFFGWGTQTTQNRSVENGQLVYGEEQTSVNRRNGPQPRCDSTTEMEMWPRPRNLDERLPLTPVDRLCHWSIPIVDIGPARRPFAGVGPADTLPACLADYTRPPNGESWNFWNFKPFFTRSCSVFDREWIHTTWTPLNGARVDTPGAAMYYGRSITYPSGTCTCGSGFMSCPI